MPARYKVVLQGFSEFERNALTFCLKLTSEREPGYEPVPRNAKADFIIADADQAGVIDAVVSAGRIRRTVFVGRDAPEGALSHVLRPIDPTSIVRELDQLLAARAPQAKAEPPAAPPTPEPSEPPASTLVPVDVTPPPWLDITRPPPSDHDEVPTVPSKLEELPQLRELPSLVSGPALADQRPPEVLAPKPAAKRAKAPAEKAAAKPVAEPVEARNERPVARAPSHEPQPWSTLVSPSAETAPTAPTTLVEALPVTRIPPPGAPPTAPTPPVVERRQQPRGSGSSAVPATSLDDRIAAKAAARAAARRARLAHATPAVLPEHPPDALVLDDSEIAQVFLCRLLSDFGFRPHPVQSGAEALDLLAQQSFTVAFLDVQLDAQDEHDGIDLCHQIKHEPISPDGSVPVVVVVSGQSKPADRVRAGLAGCDIFLTKPLSRGDVARALETCGVALPSDQRRRS